MFYATPDGQHRDGRNTQSPIATGHLLESTVHVRTTTGQGENRHLEFESSSVATPRVEGTRPSEQHQQSGPTQAREHSCAWRFFSETTTIPLTPPVLCVTVWDRRKLALWRVASVSGILYLNELTVRRAHPVCLQLDRSPDPGRQGRACKKSRFGTSSKRPPIHVSDLF